MSDSVIVLAGATGHLGAKIAASLLGRGATVRAIVRKDGDPERTRGLRQQGARIVEVDYDSRPELARACQGGSCVVSALSGLRDVIVDAQTRLLDAAVEAGVARFIPSDYAIDFAKLPDGSNRNFDLRREFKQRLDQAPIAATSVLNGMFMELLVGPAPIILFKVKRVLYWDDADQLLDFTTIDNTADFTAAAALDQSTPRFLRIAGDVQSARGLASIASDVTGDRFRIFRGGGLRRLSILIAMMRALTPKSDSVFPPWQGMQYLHNMFDGRAKLTPLDNDRYPEIRWTKVRDVLAAAEA
ncbi:MAG TPA: NmrA family NAD(P)-binding protein [Gemmatimonadaceae bacterium]|nr:NmrA family NAD(P)-binding protein [Gemmatimonadaceae bacterium]